MKRPGIVFVPYELIKGAWIRRNDLPRFRFTFEVMNYITGKDSVALSRRQLDWREEWEKESVDEFMAGVGGSKS